jgi:hypothetical protein
VLCFGAVRCDLAGNVDAVFDHHGHAEQRSGLACAQARERRVRLGQRLVGSNGYERVDLRVQPLDSRQVQLDQLTRTDVARAQQLTKARHTGKR